MWLWRRVCGEPLESEIRAILALTMSRRSGGRLAPYTSSDVARFTNMLLSLWLSPWGKLIDLEVYIPSVPLLSLKGIQLAVFTAQRFLTMWAEPTYSHAVAKTVAVITSLRPEGASLALRAGIHGGGPPPVNSADHRRKRWWRRLRLRPPAESRLA